MKLASILIAIMLVIGIIGVGGCINIDANTKAEGDYSAIGERYAEKYAGSRTKDTRDTRHRDSDDD